MSQNTISAISSSCRATELLIKKYGPNRVLQVVQRSEHIFQALLNDGLYVAVIIPDKGSPVIIDLQDADV